jgi:hypothetical protein
MLLQAKMQGVFGEHRGLENDRKLTIQIQDIPSFLQPNDGKISLFVLILFDVS